MNKLTHSLSVSLTRSRTKALCMQRFKPRILSGQILHNFKEKIYSHCKEEEEEEEAR